MADAKIRIEKRLKDGKIVWYLVFGVFVLLLGAFMLVDSVVADKLNCSKFKNHKEAQELFNSDPIKYRMFDRDHDSEACEHLK
jgi:hypothetical protein